MDLVSAKAAEKGLEQARESMRLALVRYQGGVSTQVACESLRRERATPTSRSGSEDP